MNLRSIILSLAILSVHRFVYSADLLPPVFVNVDHAIIWSHPSGSIIGGLEKGDLITIYGNEGEWVRISPDGSVENWVSSKNICSGKDCWKKVSLPVKPKLTESESPQIKTQKTDNSTSLCPCSGTKNCTGPRGGSYCITSGGKKRYR
jgi:hypothetical protein